MLNDMNLFATAVAVNKGENSITAEMLEDKRLCAMEILKKCGKEHSIELHNIVFSHDSEDYILTISKSSADDDSDDVTIPLNRLEAYLRR